MKHSILLFFAVFSVFTSFGTTLYAPGDTLRGQHKFVQLVTSDLCERLQAEQQRKPFRGIPDTDAQALLVSSMQGALLAHTEEMNILFADNKISGSRKAGELLGVEIMTMLMGQCSAGQQLMVETIRSGLGSKLVVTEAEKPVIQKVTRDICQRLSADNEQRPLATRTTAERKEAFSAAMQGGVLANMEPIASFYGFKELQNNKTMGLVGQKVVALMLDECPIYLIQFSVDEFLKKK